MKTFSGMLVLRGISISLLLAAALLSGWQWNAYRQPAPVFPAGSQIAGLPVGGLDRSQASQRLKAVYFQPVSLVDGSTEIQLSPTQAGFRLDLESMLAEAENASRPEGSWRGFLDFLVGRPRDPVNVELRAALDRNLLRTYLSDEVSARYDRPALPSLPYPGTVDFQAGVPGTALDVERAIPLVENALRSAAQRSVSLPVQPVPPPGPSFQHLETLLKQTLQLSGFDGVAGLYLQDLATAQEINFAMQGGLPLPMPPEVAFSGASIIKIPIMLSVFKRLENPPDPETDRLLQAMIEESGNEAADWVMERIIDPERAPLLVTEDMRALGLENTFLAGYFHLGAPLLALYETPANRRIDSLVDPDIYNQTTPAEIGRLLASLYRCRQSGGSGGQGSAPSVSGLPGRVALPSGITREECERMLGYLAGNKTPYLIEAGLPEEVDVIHKHGWVSLFGVINTIGDAALVSTPSADYVLVIYLYHPDLLLWEPSSALVSRFSQAVYNYYLAADQADVNQ